MDHTYYNMRYPLLHSDPLEPNKGGDMFWGGVLRMNLYSIYIAKFVSIFVNYIIVYTCIYFKSIYINKSEYSSKISYSFTYITV